ncbi:MAG: diaminopimelate decarboxylase [Cytophagaceae bacterium]|nr:diaminopimelate decarboxylase [Cytophagaceae bacterium]
MDYFHYKEGKLFCEEVPVEAIVKAAGSPCYIYSANTLREHYRKFYKAFSALDPLICFSIKTCNNLHIIQELVAEGSGIDTVSGGEIFLARKAGADARNIVFAGIGKTDEEILFALDQEIGIFNIESAEEFENLARLAKMRNKKVDAALRVTPDVVDEKTHAKTKTGYKGSKFGVDIDKAIQFFNTYGKDTHVSLCGIHIHIGSPIYSPAPYEIAIKKILSLIEELKQQGHAVRIFDIGGGYSADYEKGKSASYEDFAAVIVPLLKPYVEKGMKIILEPGRTISGNSGILVSKVLYRKEGGHKKFIIIDTGMHHLIRPALYDANHFMWPVVSDGISNEGRVVDEKGEGLQAYDVVGPICESSDYLAKDRYLPEMKKDDLLAIFTAGAYGMVMSSNYNATCKPAEIMVDKQQVFVIRERETYEDLIRSDKKSTLTV